VRPSDWEGIFHALADPVLVLDGSGVALLLSRALTRLLDRPCDDGRGVYWRTLMGPEGPPDSCPIARCLASGGDHKGEQTFAQLEGQWQVAASSYRSAEGVRLGVVVALHDVTASRRQREQVLEAARLAEIGQLAGGVAHEINTPLASIALRAENLLGRCADPELRRVPAFERFPRYLETIDREIFRCKRIVASLLEFARSGQAEVQPTDLNGLLNTAVDLVGHAARRKGAAFELRLAPRLPLVEADPGQLRQVALSLLVNAVDASGEGDAILVTTGETAQGEVFLEVSDEGAGVPGGDRERIFAPFYTTKRPAQSTGLGLAVCRQIVAAHGGRIEVGETPAAGARFRVSLPATRPGSGGGG
jgi:signal transduction histidine kinase